MIQTKTQGTLDGIKECEACIHYHGAVLGTISCAPGYNLSVELILGSGSCSLSVGNPDFLMIDSLLYYMLLQQFPLSKKHIS